MKFFGITIVLCTIISKTYAQNADVEWLYSIQKSRKPSLNTGFQALSFSVYPVSAAVPVTYFTIATLKKDKQFLQKGIQSLVSVASSIALTLALKYSIQRKRPYETYSFIIPLQKENTPSFPSGHSSMAFSIATHLALYYPKWYIIIPGFIYAGTVAYSRLYLSVHYPSDVVAGAIVGSACAYLTFLGQKHIITKKQKKSSPQYDEYHY